MPDTPISAAVGVNSLTRPAGTQRVSEPQNDGPLKFNLFQWFVTSELSHSGLWAWVLQSLDIDCPDELRDLRVLARALLDQMKVPAILGEHIRVRRERTLEDGSRVDIHLIDDANHTVVIETKVRAHPREEQIARYVAACRLESSGRAVFAAIVSVTYDEPWHSDPSQHIGATKLHDLVRGGTYSNDLMRWYVEWFDNTMAERSRAITTARGSDAKAAWRSVGNPAAQWAIMCDLGDALGGPDMVTIHTDQSRGGRTWVTVKFASDSGHDRDQLFYRLDYRGFSEFTLRQYQKPIKSGKRDRLTSLRAWYDDARIKSGTTIAVDTSPSGARTRAMEAKIAQFDLDGITPSALIDGIRAIHTVFAARLRSEGWSLRGTAAMQETPVAAGLRDNR